MAISGGDGSIVLTTKVDDAGLKKGTKSLRSEAMKLAAEYRKAGMSQSEAQKRAYKELGITAKETDKVTKKTKEFGNESEKSGSKASKAYGKVKSAIGAVGKAFVVAGAAGAAAFASAGVAAIKLGADFEQSAAKASTLFGDVAVDTDNLNKKMLELSSSTGVAATELNEALYSALSAGIPATEDMSEAIGILEGSTKLAKAGFTDIDTALSATAKTLNAYGLETTEAERIQGILIQTQNKGITTVGELGATLAQVTPTAAAFNVSFENVGAALATMTAQGTPTAQATTQLNSLIAELGKQGTIASNNLMKAAEGTQYAGMSFSEMTASGASLGDILSLIAEEAERNNVSMVDMFSSIEAGKAALSIASGEAQTFNSNLEAMTNTSGLVDEAYGKVTNTLLSQTSILKESFKNLGIAIGTGGDVDTAIQNLSTSFSNFSSVALPVMQTVTQGILQAVQGLLPELGSMVSEMLPIVVEGVIGLINGIVEAAPQITETIVGLLPTIIQGVADLISQLAQSLPTIMQSIVSALPSVIQSIVSVLPTLIPQVVSGISQAVTLLANNASSIIQPLIATLPDIIISIVDAIMTNLPLVIEGTISLVMAIVEAIPQIIDGLVQALPTIISLIISGLLKCLPQILAGLGMIVIGIVKSLPSIFASLIEGIGNIFIGIFNGIQETIAPIAEWFKGKFHEAKEKIGEAFKPVVDWFSGIYKDVQNVFKSVGNWFKTKFNEAVNGIKNAWSGVKSFFTNKWNEITGVFKNAKDKFLSIGKNIVAGIKQGIKNAWNNLKNWFSGLFGDLIGIAKKILGIKSPSREFMWIAQMIVAGLTKGIDKYGHLAVRGVEELSRNAVDVFKEIIPEMAKGILSDTRTEVQKVVDEMNEELLESERLYNEESERLKDSKLESDKEYLDNLKEIADKERKLYDARKKDVENLKETIVNAYSDMASEALDSISELQKTQESFAEKLAGYGDLTYEKKYTNKYGMKVTENRLSDLSDQTEFLEEYYDMLMAVKDRGNVPKEFFSVIRDMGLEEGLEYANSLLELSDEDFANYIREWERKQETAKNISKALYEDEAIELATSINDEFDSLKDDMFGIGKDSAGEFSDGFIQQLKFLAHDIRYALQSALGGVTIGGIGPVISGEGDVIKVPALARGGIAPRKMLAMIGERGREAVLPLENNTGWMDVLADRISARMGGASSTVVLEVDGREFGRAVVEQGNRENRRIGTRLVSR